MLKRNLTRTLAAMAALAMLPASANAGAVTSPNLNLEELAALLVFPIVTGGQPANIMSTTGDVVIDSQRASTLVTITNATTRNRLLLIDVVSGDIGEDAWKSNSYRCYMTGRETTTFVFSPAGPGSSSLHAECGEIAIENGKIVGVETDGDDLRKTPRTQNGFMVVSVATVDGQAPGADNVVGSNDLFGDAIIVDPAGQAYSVAPIGFQAGKGKPMCKDDNVEDCPDDKEIMVGNNGDKAYEFGTEYASLPSVLVSNFVAEGPHNDVNAELILLTLDGKVGGFVTPRVAIAGNVFDDDEQSDDWFYQFDCFDIVPLSEISDSFIYDPGNFNLQSPTGHFDMASGTDSAGGDVHDLNFGDANDFRNRGVHGWLVQNVDGVLLKADTPITGVAEIATHNQAAWARPLLQSTTSLSPQGKKDIPTFDATGAP